MTTLPINEQSNIIDIVSVNSSKIINVNLYTSRAEITRLYNITVKKGQNTLNISGLPNALENDSLRVQGRGAATIQDVTVSYMPSPPDVQTVTPELEELKAKKELVKRALSRCKHVSRTLTSYMENAGSRHNEVAGRVQDIIDQYNDASQKMDNTELELRKELKTLNEEYIEIERKNLADSAFAGINALLKKRASIELFADGEASVEVVLTYTVGGATWDPTYDIRVNMQAEEEKPVMIMYKAAITQITGESWDNVPLTLDTALPTYGISVPELPPWSLSKKRPVARYSPFSGPVTQPTVVIPTQPVIIPIQADRSSRSRSRSRSRSPPFRGRSRSRSRSASPRRHSRSRSFSPSFPTIVRPAAQVPLPLPNRVLTVTSKGNVNATFRVPGLITIPSDSQVHNVVVAELKLDAILSWISVPKVNKNVHLHAKIKNDSEYNFIPGPASIYIDGSFVAKTELPAVNPQESFDCALGLDPSIRITYHPCSKKSSQSGVLPFAQKTASLRYSQRITILNTKTISVDLLKIRDVIPASDDEQIIVKLTSPSLPSPSKYPNSDKKPTTNPPTMKEKGASSRASFSASSLKSALSNTTTKMSSIRIGAKENDSEERLKEMQKMPGTVIVSKNLLAQWAGVDEPDFDEASMGKNGKMNWICSLQPGETLTCTMEWDVSYPTNIEVVGL